MFHMSASFFYKTASFSSTTTAIITIILLSAGVGTQDLAHIRQVLCCYVTPQPETFSFLLTELYVS